MLTRLSQALLIVLLGSSLLYAGSRWNNNNTEPAFNQTAQVTKTASYTATLSDSYIKVTTSTANLTVTLPAISTLSTNGLGSKGYKIEKTDAVRYNVLLAPASGDTIDGTTGYAITHQNDFVVISATAGSTNWVIGYADDVVDTNVTNGAVSVGGPLTVNSVATLTLTATTTLTGSQCGTELFLNSATEFATTLPVPTAGCFFKIWVAAAPSGASYTIVTNASANIIVGAVNNVGVTTAGIVATVGDIVTLVDGQAVAGDWVSFLSDGTSWYMDGQVKVYAGATTGST